MNRFAALLDRLVLTPQRNGKLRLLVDYFRDTPDPDRGYALAGITRDLEIASVKPAMIRTLVEERLDQVLFAYSYDYVGDLAETVSLVWPEAETRANRVPTVADVVETLHQASRSDGPGLVMGGLRIGVSARLAKQALAQFGGKDIVEIEELWHGLEPPYLDLFAWLEDRGDKPAPNHSAPFRPVMLAHPLMEKAERADADIAGKLAIAPEEFAAEWKWDGIRVQAAAEGGERRLYSRTGDDISDAFPDVLDALDFEGAIDGELLVMRPDTERDVAPFGDLQQRLNRKTVSNKLLASHPAFIRAYDLLTADGNDLRGEPFQVRRNRLEAFIARHGGERLDLSPLVPFASLDDLAAHRESPPHAAIEGLMLKRWDSLYQPGRPKGPWFKWKRDPFLIDVVLLYAQRGHGKRSSFYSDYTFGVWRPGDNGQELVPVGKAYFGFTDEELKRLDKYVRDNTVERFGPVRSVRAEPDHGLVLEVAFEGLNRSTRHKSGVAMRFPRIHRIRDDKPPGEADTLEALTALLD